MATLTIVVRYFAAARAAAGAEEEKVQLPDGATVSDAVAELRRLHPDGGLPRVLEAATHLLDRQTLKMMQFQGGPLVLRQPGQGFGQPQQLLLALRPSTGGRRVRMQPGL